MGLLIRVVKASSEKQGLTHRGLVICLRPQLGEQGPSKGVHLRGLLLYSTRGL